MGAGDVQKVQRVLKEEDFVGTFREVDAPGHSDGHISFFRERDGVLIVGDVLVNMNLLTAILGLHEPPHLFTPNPVMNRESIKKLAGLKPENLCFGHGPVLYNMGDLKRFLQKKCMGPLTYDLD